MSSVSIEEIIDDLVNEDKLLLDSHLSNMSNLSLEELEILERVWVTIKPKRRRQVIYRLVELAEEYFELNFDNTFRQCLKDLDAEVRSKAIEGLWENEEISLVEPLIRLLNTDNSEEVQASAAKALGKFAMMAEHNKLRPIYASRLSQSLLAVINDDNRSTEIRCRALEAAAPLGMPEINKSITEAYQVNNTRFKISAVYSMGKNCNPDWLPIVLKELSSTDIELRYEAAGACGELGELEAVSYLTALINDPDIDVQMAVIGSLGRLGGPEAKMCLEQCLEDPSEAIRQSSEQALREIEEGEDLSIF
ncbi:HEAT repeat domain-containing protein [Chloroflexota bacterium]